MHAPLEKSQCLSSEAFDLCSKLLERDPNKRLGVNGCEEIQQHSWFKGIDWDALARKETEPPFQPNVVKTEEEGCDIPVLTQNSIVPFESSFFKSFELRR